MAERPSVKEILAAARQGSPAPSPGSIPKTPKTPDPPPLIPKADPLTESASPPPPTAGPLSIKDKLAAARSGGGSAPVAATPSLKTPILVDSPPSEPSTGRALSIKEKLAAAKTGGAAPPVVVKAVSRPEVARTAAPSKIVESREPKALAEALRKAAELKEKTPIPTIPKVEPAPISNRRQSLAVLAAIGVAFLAGLTWLFRKVLSEPPRTVKIGPATGLKAGSVRSDPAWDFVVVERSGKIIALRSACTHLGCPTKWVEAEGKFQCPCHGSRFDADGVNIAGPAPRPLERYKVSMTGDGQVLVDRSRTFRKDLGEWDDPSSFVLAG